MDPEFEESSSVDKYSEMRSDGSTAWLVVKPNQLLSRDDLDDDYRGSKEIFSLSFL